MQNQWGNNGGKCGECGDPWEIPIDERPNQAGGLYATGTITGQYEAGQVSMKILTCTERFKYTGTCNAVFLKLADIGVKITAMHWGWYEFRVCDVGNKET